MTLRIVPAIDLLDGRCVRLKQGDFSEKEIVGADPVDVARRFEQDGFCRLHLVDLSGARAGSPKHLGVLESICSSTKLCVDYSGGLRTTENVKAALAAGASQVVVGSAAVKNREACEEWFRTFGAEKMILGLDVLDGRVRVSGWEEETELTLESVVGWYRSCGLRYLMSTDISRDGMLQGPSLALYEHIRNAFPDLFVIASGGVSQADDITALAERGVNEVIVGKALYAATLDVARIREYVW